MNTGQPPHDRPARIAHYDAAQVRLDTWNGLKVHASWLHEFSRAGRDHEEPRSCVGQQLETLRALETYWAFPGAEMVEGLTHLFEGREYDDLSRHVDAILRLLVGGAYRSRPAPASGAQSDRRSKRDQPEELFERADHDARPYFEVLFVDTMGQDERRELRHHLLELRRDEDEFIYDIVVVPSFEDAVVAALFNRTIQSVIPRYTYGYFSNIDSPVFERYRELLLAEKPDISYGLQRSLTLGRILKSLRPELDLFLVTDAPLEEVAGHLGRAFERAFYRLDNYLELHLSILKGIRSRYETPFFDALRRYSQKPTGVFHALPIARAKSITNSHWINDMGRFYGPNVFLAETSATSGGLDSLLQPHGTIKRAQDHAARAFGAQHTFFVTNGTSTANKIVVQALSRPGDIVLASRDCHKSHHYAILLAGAHPVYLDPYPLTPYSIYGAVPLREIKHKLLELKRAGKLHRVRMLLLTNCTFDGITYDPQRVMREVLAIKPDMIFVWDEAWFAFAACDPTLRQRTAMTSAAKLRQLCSSSAYREEHDRWMKEFEKLDPDDDATWLQRPLMADPDRVRLRVYATHSTHKTLTALRQGSMIHVWDEDFDTQARDAVHEAFMTHTSTSPNYQIIASLDVGRRQVELEGYELVQKSIGLAMVLRERIYEHPGINRYFTVLRPADVIPAEFRPSGLEFYYDPQQGWGRMGEAWRNDEFTLDPTRVTVHVGHTGMDGNTFRHLLIDEHDIQINKTSRNTVLFMTNIGMSRGDVAYLTEVLVKIAGGLDQRLARLSPVERRLHDARVSSLTRNLPPLPNFSRFHRSFLPDPDSETPEGDMRKAFFLAYDQDRCEHLGLDEAMRLIRSGRELVSAVFVTPYPPGFPILVPGQTLSVEILEYLKAVDVKEIHGYRADFGLRVFTPTALEEAMAMEAQPQFSALGGA